MPVDVLYEANKAYLQPLLQKHEKGQVLIHEDLASALRAAKAVLTANEDDIRATSAITRLHKSQLSAYGMAAKSALKEWVTSTYKLPDVGDTKDEEEYVEKCIQKAREERPNWKISNTNLELIMEGLRTRAKTQYKESQVKAEPETPIQTDKQLEKIEEDNDEDGQVDEDEMQDEEGEVDDDDDEDGEINDDNEEGEEAEDNSKDVADDDDDDDDGEIDEEVQSPAPSEDVVPTKPQKSNALTQKKSLGSSGTPSGKTKPAAKKKGTVAKAGGVRQIKRAVGRPRRGRSAGGAAK